MSELGRALTSHGQKVAVVVSNQKEAEFIEAVLTEDAVTLTLKGSLEDFVASVRDPSLLPDVLIVSYESLGRAGPGWFDRLLQIGIDSPVIVTAPERDMKEAVHVMRWGAFDLLVRDRCTPEKLRNAVGDAVRSHHQRVERESGSRPIFEQVARPTLLGTSPAMRRVRELVEAVAAKDSTVLVSGETGTGKEVVARMIHTRSDRVDGRFVPVNCGAFSPNVLESELFGHTRGAFTGASQARPGLLVTASGGSLFLDEVSELELSMQVRLLRVLQESEVRPVGADKHRSIDTRIIAATNRSLPALVKSGHFREDLYYRLNVFEIQVPPLRERSQDIPLLADHFIEKYSQHFERSKPRLSGDALAAFEKFAWPGNVRQLENVIERALILCREEISLDHVDLQFGASAEQKKSERPSWMRTRLSDHAEGMGPLRTEKDQFERDYLRALMRYSNNNRSVAARVAHIDPSNLRRLLKRHGLL